MTLDLDNEPPRRNRSLAAALELYDEHGLNPLAAAPRTKIPLGEWRRWQTEIIPRRTVEVAFSGGRRNIWCPTGGLAPGNLLALDCDSDEAVEYWRERLGDVLDETACQRTGRGTQFFFVTPAGEPVRGVDGRKRPGELEWEIKGDGQGVILPPSEHPSGATYTWVRGMAHRVPAPEELLEAAKEAKEAAEEGAGGERSKLADLLQSPAVAGGRNNWLAAVAGHYAKLIPYRDAYETLVWQAAAACRPPLTDDDPESPGEISKLVSSIWASERDRKANLPVAVPVERPEGWGSESWQSAVREPKLDTGYLATGGDCILIQCRKSADADPHMDPWMDADVKVLGVIAGEGERSFLVELRRARDGATIPAILPSVALASWRELSAWLGARGVSIAVPPQVYPRVEATPGNRLLRYMEAQRAPEAKVIPHIGAVDGDFITHDEVIREAGSMPHEAVRPDPGIRDWAPFRYGFGAEAEAQAVLRKILEFHDEEVASVFGAWWAAVLLKPFVVRWVSQFPIMGLEAPSESGKTTGFFELMHRLSGYTGPQMNPTRAALRDYLTAHNAGYVWVDDLDALGDREELLRQVTVGGSLVKKSGDHQGQTSAIMRAALVISGESLGLSGQKALLDRVVVMEVPSPKGRMAADGQRSQWEEIVDFRGDYPDLSAYSGTLVQRALGFVSKIHRITELRTAPGRHGDKIAVLRLGARLLTYLVGDEDRGHIDRVDGWCDRVEDLGAENALTLRVLPWALAQTEWKARPMGPDDSHSKVATPALVDEGYVWFSPRLLAHWWMNYKRGNISERTETEEALTQQARALGMGGRMGVDRKNFMFVGGSGKAKYWRCSEDISKLVLERSRD